jgi:peptidoglycan-associated lipoprotein
MNEVKKSSSTDCGHFVFILCSMKWRMLPFFIAAALLGSGCSLNKGYGKYSKSYIGVDTPLSEYALDKFSEPTGVSAGFLQDIHFAYDKYTLKPEEQDKLGLIVIWLKKNSTTHLLMEGYCDERGSNEYNLALGEQRALAVRQFLINEGLRSKLLQTVSYGEERPCDSGHSETAWIKNRRVHFKICGE